MNAATAVAAAAAFVWVGLVIGISGLEAPLKFRAPGVTLRIGLAIGRVVFRAVNVAEAVLALVVVVGIVIAKPGPVAIVALAVAVVALLVQLALIRPRLNRRADAVLAGADAPRSQAHHAYIVVEAVKLIALLVGGIGALAAL